MEENRRDENRKGIIVSVVTILTLIIMMFGITYAVFLYTYKGKQENVLKTGAVTFAYAETSNGISITNAEPMSDDAGKKIPASGPDVERGYFDFYVTATMSGNEEIRYDVIGENITDVASKLDPRYVKVYLTNGDGEVPYAGYNQTVPTYAKLTQDGVTKLYSGVFNSTGTHRFRLRLWVSQDYPETARSEQFKMKVNVNAYA